MATPRCQLIDPEYPMHYHLISRCVRRSWLCGVDPMSGRNYEHRKAWLQHRLFHLAKCFAVAIDGYAIMSNHFHLVVYFDPKESYRWSDEEVADRWLTAFTPQVSGLKGDDPHWPITLETYLDILKDGSRDYTPTQAVDKKSRWFDRVASLRKKERLVLNWCYQHGEQIAIGLFLGVRCPRFR